MDIIGFIGVYDKTDLLLNIAKILTKMQKKVLIVDTTLEQKTKYVVPAINPTASYITNFEDFDVAIGFDSLEQIKKYFGIQEGLQYDIILVNADSVEAIESFDLINSKKNFFVTGFDLYSLKRGLEIFSEIKQPIVMTKILFSTDMQSGGNEYLNYLASNYKITWNELLTSDFGDYILVRNQEQRNMNLKSDEISIVLRVLFMKMVKNLIIFNSIEIKRLDSNF